MIYSPQLISKLHASSKEHCKQTHRKLLVDRDSSHQTNLWNGYVIKYSRMISQSYKLIQTFIIVQFFMHKVPHALQSAIVRLLHFKMIEGEITFSWGVFLDICSVLMNLQAWYYSILAFFWALKAIVRINPKIQCLMQLVLVCSGSKELSGQDPISHPRVTALHGEKHFLCTCRAWCLSKDK